MRQDGCSRQAGAALWRRQSRLDAYSLCSLAPPSDRGPTLRQLKRGELELPLLRRSSSDREDSTADECNDEEE